MSSPSSSAATLFAAAVMMTALAGCIGPDFPTAEQSVCTVAGIGCRPECSAALMPSAAAGADTLTYHLGPASCAPVAFDAASRQADRLCRARGFDLAADAAAVTEEPPVRPLPPAETATFRCEPRA